MSQYKLTSWADGFGIWHCRVDFPSPGVGNSPEAEAMKHRAMDAAKRRIRNEITARQNLPVGRLSYEVTANKIDSLNRMWSITISER